MDKRVGLKALRYLAIVLLAGTLAALPPHRALAECPVPAVEGVQPYPDEVSQAFRLAAANQLGSRGPIYPPLRKGYPQWQDTSASFPPTILMAIGRIESNWRQFVASPGGVGTTLINRVSDPWCAYGIMQIVSGMDGSGGFDPPRVAAEHAYNIGTGALILLYKWNYLAGQGITIGGNDPVIMEDWYYAVWAYHYWGYRNNPNNERYLGRDCANRNPYWNPFDPASYPASCYPYQELVWGYVANPPVVDGKPLWQPVQLSFPDPEAIGINPGHIPDPQPTHTDTAQVTPTPTPSPTPTPTTTPTPTPTPVLLDLPHKYYFPFIQIKR